MAYMRDHRSSRLDHFDPLRDLPTVLGWWDFSTLTGTDGARIARVSDQSTWGHDLAQTTDSAKPAKQTDATDGKPVARFQSLKRLACGQLGTTWPVPSVKGAVTMSVLVKFSSSETRPGSLPVLLGSSDANNPKITFHTGAGIAYVSGRINGNVAGPNLKDDAWHVVTAVADNGVLMLWVDGALASTASGAFAEDTTANICIDGILGDVREAIVSHGRVSAGQIDGLNRYMASRAPTPPSIDANVRGTAAWLQTSSPNGQAVRLFEPAQPDGTLVMWQHPHTQNEQLTAGYYMWPLISAATARGWTVAASNQHGDSWGNDNAVADLVDLRNLVHSRTPVTDVVLVGGSMGGVSSLIAASRNSIPNIRGVYLVDGVCDLANMHANASYTTSIRTAYGVAGDGSDFATLTAANDPMRQSVSTFAGKRIRFQASSADTSVPKTAHADAMSTRLGSTPVENQVHTHGLGHLAGIDCLDVVKFIERCVA